MKKLKKVLIIGSGPIVIGQAAEFDYSGTQACLTLREAGINTVLVNPNPATIQTDQHVADIVYFEPLQVASLTKIIAKEKPQALLATMGGQTALNLACELADQGVLKKFGVTLLGTDIQAIKLSEDRGLFKDHLDKIGEPTLPATYADSVADGQNWIKKIGLPVIVRSAFTLSGTGSSLITEEKEILPKLQQGISLSPVGKILIEKSVAGWCEMEYEIIRDAAGNKIAVCNMENIDPMGVHTGESIVVAPSQTLTDDEVQILRSSALHIVDSLNIKGGCNVQFSLNRKTGEYYVIEVNPRLSRSSALASKATGYPIARVAANIALGKLLPKIINPITGKTAMFEPALDYVVLKVPQWPHAKFPDLDKSIDVSMKSTGEVMVIGGSFEEAFVKVLPNIDNLESDAQLFSSWSKPKLLKYLQTPTTHRLTALLAAFDKKISLQDIVAATQINFWFIYHLYQGFVNQAAIRNNLNVYKMVDTCAGEFEAKTPYFYSTSGQENEAHSLKESKVIIIGSGPIKIGQGVEFDYLTVHAVKALQSKGIKAIVINNNPETVSTDYATSDRLYFEPLSAEFILKVIENEKENLLGVITQFGGQTALNVAPKLAQQGVKLLGTNVASIIAAEDREHAAQTIQSLGLKVPPFAIVSSKTTLQKKSPKFGFPFLIRPSFVLAGEGMMVIQNKTDLDDYLKNTPDKVFNSPVILDQFFENALEFDIEILTDGTTTHCFILEQLETAGVHSGDSTCVYPSQHISKAAQAKIIQAARKIAKAFKIRGLANVQALIKNNQLYILEINPRASRTVPFLSKCLGVSLTQYAVEIMLGKKLPKNIPVKNKGSVGIKKPVFSFHKLPGLSIQLGPVMKSTGEVMALAKNFEAALAKANTMV